MNNWGKYNIIDSMDKIRALDEYLMNDDGSHKFPLKAYDTETTGIPYFKSSIIGFSFAVDRHRGFYIPILIWEPDPKSRKMKSIDKVKTEVFEKGRLKNIWTGTYHPETVAAKDVDYPDFIPAIVDRWYKGKGSQLLMWNAPFDINHTFIDFGVDLKDDLALDGGLLAHIKNENESVGLKENAVLYQNALGFNMYARADQEKRELKASIIRNGGKSYMVWRADPVMQAKYACADASLTFGTIEVLLSELEKEHGEKFPQIMKWIVEEEVMPLCREVVIDMKRRGVYIDLEHFKTLAEQNNKKLLELEDQFIEKITPFLDGFDIGKSIDEAVSHQKLIKRIANIEGLPIPTTVNKKTGAVKESFAKAAVKKEYERNPHWLWGYLLGEDELKYSPEKLTALKTQMFEESSGRRYRFNLNSNDHLIWLFFDKLGENRKSFPKTPTSTEEDWKPSIDADSIRDLLLEKYEWINILLKYKKVQKIQSTYVQPAIDLQIDSWLYMDMKQNGTTSGRFSCSGGFNLQTLPRVDDELEALEQCDKCDSKNVRIEAVIECVADRHCLDCGHVEHDIVRPSAIKKGFIAPPGYKIVNADYASLEPRAFAYISGEDNIKAVYRDGLDLYSKVYCDIFDKDKKYSADPKAPNYLKKANPAARKFIKPIVLGIPYGCGDAQVANMTGNMIKSIDEDGVTRERPNMQEGKRIRDLYLETYPNLTTYMNDQEYMAVEYGFVDSKYGRRRHFQWAKLIGDFISNLPCGYDLEKMEKIKFFTGSPKSKLTGGYGEVKDFNTRRIIFNLTPQHLQELSRILGMSFLIDKFGKPGVLQKGGWAYIRSLLKSDLNNAKNHPIQAIAGHIANQGMLETTRLMISRKSNSWVALQIHDELMAYSKIEDSGEAAKAMQQGMEDNIFTLPLKSEVVMVAEPVICDNLKQAK